MTRSNEALEIAFVNNMPDAALVATERQFERLVRAGAQGRAFRWRRYVLPGQDRSDKARRYVARTHETIDALYHRGADALIVSGTEPRADLLRDEPYWPHIRELIEWARDHTRSAIWSCLAAHAAVLHLAGIDRRRETRKMSGVYVVSHCAADWISRGKETSIVPHSRHNGLDRAELERHGFRICTFSNQVGVDMFWRNEPSRFLFLQGHPEYEADSLAREYRRDTMRYLSGLRAEPPAPPEHVFDEAVSERLHALAVRICEGRELSDGPRRLKEILETYKYQKTWEEDAVSLFREWIRITDGPTAVTGG